MHSCGLGTAFARWPRRCAHSLRLGVTDRAGRCKCEGRYDARSPIDLDDERRACEAGSAPHCTAGAFELIPDKNILIRTSRSRGHTARAQQKKSDEGIFFTGAAICSRIHHERISAIGNAGRSVDVFSTSGIIGGIRSADCGLFWCVRRCPKPACRSGICGAFYCSLLSPSIRFPPTSSPSLRRRRPSIWRRTIGGFSRSSITNVGSVSIFFARFSFSI